MTELERSNKELEDFANIVAHDLQEPLRKIILFGDRMETMLSAPEATQKDNIYRIRRSAMRMESLMDDLLIYSRLNAKTQSVKEIDLENLIHVVIDDLEVRIKETKGKIYLKTVPDWKGNFFR